MRAYEQLLVSFGPALVRKMILEERGGGVCIHCGGDGKCNCRGCVREAGSTDQHRCCTVCGGSGTIGDPPFGMR